jgi:hypothetical protein
MIEQARICREAYGEAHSKATASTGREPAWAREITLQDGFVGIGSAQESERVYFQIFMCGDDVLRAAWQRLDDNGQPTGPYITRMRALELMGGEKAKDWKKVMRFNECRIDAAGHASDVDPVKTTTWHSLEEEDMVPKVTPLVASQLGKLNGMMM